MRGMRIAVVAALAIALLAAAPASAKVAIEVLSNRAEAVSGGDALVAVKLPKGTKASRVRVSLNGRRVTRQFALRRNGRYEGLLTGLRNGPNKVVARVPGGEGARLTIRNHPIGGPVTSGPQIQPWTCFPGAVDRQCNRPVELTFHYMPRGGSTLQPYDPANPPSDVANTTTDQGRTVPFIVRQERGALDRDEFRIAVLFQPGKPWQPWAPQPGYNHKLVTFHGVSCDTSYEQDSAPDVLNVEALGRGFATMSHALNHAGHNCNIATQAESMIMAKERVAERYGPIRYTIGSGCSGGSLTQQQVANAYPGVYQGITPACSFTDAWSSAMLYVDYQLLRRYFENPAAWAPGVTWGASQIAAVEGHPNPLNAITFTTAIPSSGDPSRSCPGVPAEKVYNPQSNPRGVRCSLHDYMVNIFGRRAKDGFAQRPFDNVGIEYGRKALAAGAITPAQFADLNDKLGGWDIDYNPTRARVPADRPALSRVYRSGAINQADQLDKVAIIDLRGPDPGAFHDVYRTYAMRARLLREHGTAANQVLWRGQVPLLGDANYADESIVAMDRWLAAVERDKRRIPLARKIIQDKPASVKERCTNGAGGEQPASACDAAVQSYSSVRIEAGMNRADDTMKCVLKPLRRADYPASLTDAQFARLRAALPQGVCDYGKPGVDRTPTVPWLSYAGGPGGKSLGDPDTSTSFGCLSRRSRIGRRGIGRVRLGLTRRRLLARRVPGAGVETRRSWRWCVKRSRGKVRAAFSSKGKVALVATTAHRYGSRRLHPGMRVRPGLRRLLGRRRVIGVRRGKVRFIAVTSPRVAKNRKLLRRYLKLAGL